MLRSLKMRHARGVLAARRMAQAVQDLMDPAMVRHWFKKLPIEASSVRAPWATARGAPAFAAAMPILSQLLKAEMAEREVRSIHYPASACKACRREGPVT